MTSPHRISLEYGRASDPVPPENLHRFVHHEECVLPVGKQVKWASIQFHLPVVLNILELDTEPSRKAMKSAIAIHLELKLAAHSL